MQLDTKSKLVFVFTWRIKQILWRDDSYVLACHTATLNARSNDQLMSVTQLFMYSITTSVRHRCKNTQVKRLPNDVKLVLRNSK